MTVQNPFSVPPPPLRASLRALAGAPLEDELEAPFLAELADTNWRRLRVLFPIMMVGHLLHVAWFHLSDAERAQLAPRIIEWRQAILYTHLLSFFVAALLTLIVYRVKRPLHLMGPVSALLYLLHGVATASFDQLTITGVTPFIGYCLATAAVTVFTPRQALVVYALGCAAFIAGIHAMQPDPSARQALLPNGVSISVLSVSLAWLMYLARRRDFVQRVTIEKQRAELTALNLQLEGRVASQVGEITRRAEEVEQLNAQLQAQVRERSNELSLALERLAARRGDDARLARGTVLGQRFVVEGLIGEGGMGAVYSGTDQSTGARVAIKVIQASSARQLDALRRFLREAKLAATVSHPGIVRMLHVDVSDDGMLFQAQELVDGESLQSCLREGRRWDALVTARLLAALCDALAAAHAQGIVHRDVKAGNVMLTGAEPGLKLLDFGISKLRQDAREVAQGQTRTGVFLGTPAYMAPEQLDGTSEITDRADVYAAGVLAFLLLSGRYPFEHLSLAGAIMERQSMVPALLDEVEPSAPKELCILVGECLRREPDERPSTNELAHRLAAFADAYGAPSLVELHRMGRVTDLNTPASIERATVRSMPTRARG